MKVTKFFVQILLILLTASVTQAQHIDRCGTHQHFKNNVLKNPTRKAIFDEVNRKVTQNSKSRAQRILSTNDTIYLPIVFHILIPNQNLLSDQQIHEQLIRLNEDFAGKNADSILIPSYFKPRQGKSIIQFKLAQRTPEMNETTGIIRYANALNSYNVNEVKIHYSSMGGADAWDNKQYINVWVGRLQGDVLGQATYPLSAPPEEDGLLIDYGTMPGGDYAPFNKGRTLTHEMGHFLFLYHIWGDDDGGCDGTDEIDDTPNQADATTGCHTGRKFDACTPSGDGIMYQNYMDYSTDDCLVMFTNMQVERMMQALELTRPTLLTSLGAEPVMAGQNNVIVQSIVANKERVCEPSNFYDITFKNIGSEKITSLLCSLAINNTVLLESINVDLDTYETYVYRLNVENLQPGNNTIAVEVLKVNNVDDDHPSNNLLSVRTVYATTRNLPYEEDFSVAGFPPVGWYIHNPDNDLTWMSAGNLGVLMPNYNYPVLGQFDYLVMPPVQLPNVDSILFSFDIAAAVYSNLNENLSIWDTLKIEVTNGCDGVFQTVYKKTKGELITLSTPQEDFFIPNANQWRRDSIDLSSFKNSVITLRFTNINGYENNIYLDNLKYRAVGLPALLREQGYMIVPNPVNDIVQIRFLETPQVLKRIAIYDINGKRVQFEQVNKGTYYQMNLSTLPRGVYFITIETDQFKETQKIIKL